MLRDSTPSSFARRYFIISLIMLLLLLLALSPVIWMGSVEAQSFREVKAKTFYLHTSEDTKNVGSVATQHIMNTTVGTSGQTIYSQMRIIARWLMYPELADDLTLNGTFTMYVWWKASATGPGATWSLTISEVFQDGTSQIVATASLSNSVNTSFEEDSVSASVLYTFSEGSSVEAHIDILGDAATWYTIEWGNATRDSRVALPAQDYIRIVPQGEGGIVTTDSERNVKSNFDPAAQNKTIYVQAKLTDPFGGYDIHWVNLTVEDPDGNVVPQLDNISMPKVSGFFNSFESVHEVSWNYSGYPEGRYNITVYALDKNGRRAFEETGDFGGHLEVETGVFFIGAPPIEVHIRVVDGDGANLPGAQVLILFGGVVQAQGATNATGGFEVNLAPGIYEMEVWWKDTLVGSFPLDATEDAPFDAPLLAQAAVYDLVFSAVDSKGAGLSKAALAVKYPNGTVSDPPLVLDDEGNVTLPDMPGGRYDLTVLWTGKVVAEKTFDIQLSGNYLVSASVYYVDFTAVDADGVVVENALVTVFEPAFGTIVESRLTNLQGKLVSRVPLGDYEVRASWFGIPVLAGQSLSVSGDVEMTLSLSILSTEFIPVDSRGISLEDAAVSISAGGFTRISNTLSGGSVTLRVPIGDYSITVMWHGVTVFDALQTVDGTVGTIQLPADVFYLTLTVRDARGSPLTGAFVTILRDGETVGAGSTDAEGKAEFRLPAGTYRVQVSYRTTHLLTQISTDAEASADVSQDLPLEVTISSFPPPIYATVLLYILIGVAAIAAGLVYVLLKFKEVI